MITDLTPRACPAWRIGYGDCARGYAHPGWHASTHGEEWPQHAEDPTLDAILGGPGYHLPAIELTGDAR